MSERGFGDEAASLVQRNIESIARLEQAALRERSTGEKIGRALIRTAGRPDVVALNIVIFTCWIALNGAGLYTPSWQFDPPPYPILELVASLEAIMLALLILISQNRLQREADHRAHLNLQINMMAEMEGTKILQMLHALGRHLNVPGIPDDELAELVRETDPEHLAQSIKRDIIDEES